jgi:glycine betaine/choline ABC-type transport system substrate-binding protein
MRAMNADVVQRGQKPAAVAARFLRQVGLMSGPG